MAKKESPMAKANKIAILISHGSGKPESKKEESAETHEDGACPMCGMKKQEPKMKGDY